MKKGRKPPARRNPVAVAVRRVRPKVKPSGKTYQRKSKHQNRRPTDGGFPLGPAPQIGCTAAA